MSNINEEFRLDLNSLHLPPRLLLGPGPSNAHPRVLQALGLRQVGHLDPSFIQVMDESQALLRYLWQTDNELTLAISGTGTAAMEAAVANAVEPGDVVLAGVNGYFGGRIAEMARRYGGDVRCIEKPWGEAFTLEELGAALEQHRPAVLALVHVETSSGVRQPLEGIGDLCRRYDCLLLVDAVASLGGLPFFTDEWQIDIAYSGGQKCISCPPGASPLTFGPRAVEKLEQRQSPVVSWYLDLSLLRQYWGRERVYHHTAPINLYYALREALRLIAEEGLEARWARHEGNAELFWQGLAERGLDCHVAREIRAASVTTVRVPEGVDARAVQQRLLNDYNIEISGGLGQLAGKVWRVGLMGFNSRRENVVLLLAALEEALQKGA